MFVLVNKQEEMLIDFHTSAVRRFVPCLLIATIDVVLLSGERCTSVLICQERLEADAVFKNKADHVAKAAER